MIRPMLGGEIGDVLALYGAGYGQACYDELGLSGQFNKTHFVKTWHMLLEGGLGIWLMDVPGKRGAIGGVVHDDIFTGEKIAQEIFWYVKPEYRGTILGPALMRAFLREAKERKCVRVRSAVPRKMGRLGNVYKAMGFDFLEAGWERGL